ncbi:MAG: carboxypeptidase-like regulatory domain-containing protein [Elusimicrobiota bacterium]
MKNKKNKISQPRLATANKPTKVGNYYSLLTNSTGFSQVEIVVTILVISIVILGIITTFSTIGKGLITGKTRTIANNLAQEKIEILKNISYARLLTTSEDDLISPGYDNTNTDYIPESLNVGDANYTRYTTVWKAEESGTEISTMSPTATDQGIKKIKIEVKWTENNEQKSLVLYNLRDDPNRTTMSGKIYGIITTTNSVGISAARVEVVQDINRSDTTSTTGYYIIKTTSPATVQISVSKDGYFSKVSAATAVSAAVNLQLTAKEKGNAYGFVYKRDHLVISEICIALTEDATEYVELYNPTTYTITVENNYILKYVDNSDFLFTCENNTVDSHKYFLIASYPSVTGIQADATYLSAKMPNASNTGGVGLLTTADVWIDSIAWGPAGSIPDNAKEGSGFAIAAGNFSTNDSIERISYSSYTTSVLMWDNSNGNAYDNDKNEENWVFHDNQVKPQNTTSTAETPVLGTPVGYAVVSANDGLSSAVNASSTGYYYLTGIATGTVVTIYGSSLTLMGLVPNNNITTGGKTKCDIILSSTSEGGFISGRVIRGDTLAGVADITVSAGVYSAVTDTSGNFSFSVDVGSYTVIANPDYTSVPDGAKWTSGTSQAEANKTVEVNYGASVSAGDLKIYAAGWISGHTYNASGGDLPYITIRTTSPTSNFSTDVVSGTDGTYMIKGAKTATDYDLYPVLDDADSFLIWNGSAWVSSTEGYSVDLSQGEEETGKDFRITSAWGKIQGSVSDTAIGGNIKTGVLIIATTDAMPADSPPAISGGSVGGTNTIYYGTISDSSGNYSVSVRKGWTYNLKSWYTKISGATVVVQPTKTGTVIFGVSDSSATVSFPWP